MTQVHATDPRVLVVDHHDSYTWNLVHLVASVTGTLPTVVQHDEVDAETVLDGPWTHLVLSPGPGHPEVAADFAVGRRLVAETRVPLLGVCLGLQGIVVGCGGRVDRVAPAHGDVAPIHHTGGGVLAGLPTPFDAVRYHSLAAVSVPDELHVVAWTPGARPDDPPVVMAVAHHDRPLHGVQFHPESILSRHGARIVATFLGQA